MNINEMMNMIDRKVGNDKEKERKKEIEINERFRTTIEQIRALKPRIDDLLKLANYAKDNGIDFNKSVGYHEAYDTGMFYTNSWSHLVGFVAEEPIVMLGINAGGACGNVDFRTNGERVFGLMEDTNKIVQPKLFHMEKFVQKFDELEREFYEYIEKVCK